MLPCVGGVSRVWEGPTADGLDPNVRFDINAFLLAASRAFHCFSFSSDVVFFIIPEIFDRVFDFFAFDEGFPLRLLMLAEAFSEEAEDDALLAEAAD